MEDRNLIQIILSESSFQQQIGTKPNNQIINPFLALELPYIPSAASFSISIVGALKNQKSQFVTRVSLIMKDNPSVIIFDTGDQNIGNPSEIVFENLNLNLNVDLKNIAIPDEGVFIAIAKINNIEYNQEFIIRKVKN